MPFARCFFQPFLIGVGLDNRPAGLIGAAGDIEGCNAEGLEIAGDVLAFLLIVAIIPEVGAVHTHGNGEVGAAGKRMLMMISEMKRTC